MSWFRLQYGKSGKLISCEPIDKPEAFAHHIGPSLVVEIEAIDEQDAKHRAYNFYCARKKKVAKARHYEAGECACGRKQDRKNTKTGIGFFKTCSVCSERQESADRRYADKKKQGLPLVGTRNESGRIEAFQGRVRDRKNEMRLEVLLEVRKVWEDSRTSGDFTRWLKEQIAASVEPRRATDAA